MIDLPEALVSQIRDGRAVLLLGAGASIQATTLEGMPAPTTQDLADRLANRFLSDVHHGSDLLTVAELAVSETDLHTVQEYISSLLLELKPTAAHTLLPTFRWRGLATTNYDRLIESAYQSNPLHTQSLFPLISDNDKMEDALAGADRLPLLKLHGCISRTRDESIPFILTPDQYVNHRRHRDSLFRTLQEWGSDSVLVAVGQSLRDQDLRYILLELDQKGLSRPRFYIVGPSLSSEEGRFWEGKRITPIRCTFDEFMDSLNDRLPTPLRSVVIDDRDDLPIERRLTRPILRETRNYLASETDFVHGGMEIKHVEPGSFYRGLGATWSAILQNLDVRRRLVDTLLYEVILADDSDRRSPTEFFLVSAEAGAGKSLCLQRTAWEAATEAERICLYITPEGRLDPKAILDVAAATDERLFLFVDNAAEHVDDLDTLLSTAQQQKLRLTVISAERQNQWHIYCEALQSYLSADYRLNYLNHNEIVQLLRLLADNSSLGYLEQLPHDKRVAELQDHTGRQLLVALLEATHGRPLEDILLDEFEHIVPERAQSLYLTVCVLNRLDIPVRAGLISRIHDIPFTDFREELFKPLEHVVRAEYSKRLREYLYRARHPLIAQVVFERILLTTERRFDEYSRLLQALNLSYATDEAAFRQMIRGRTVLELFPQANFGSALFEIALSLSPGDPHVLHQQGISEMLRPQGDLDLAEELLRRALEARPRHYSVVHSLAELERRRADQTGNPALKKKRRDEAVRLARLLPQDSVHGAFGSHTILKTHIDRLREALAPSDPGPDDLDRIIADTEQALEVALQRFPDEDYILASEAEFAQLLEDHDRARIALATAFDRNSRSPYIATRLARSYENAGQSDKALEVLQAGIAANESDRQLNVAYAMLLRKSRQDLPDMMIHHLRRSFRPGDENIQAQFWFACYQYMKDSTESVRAGQETFATLRQAGLEFAMRTRIRARFTDQEGIVRSFTGVVRLREETFGWIERDGLGDSIWLHKSNVAKRVWADLRERQLVQFEIGFTFAGPVALSVETGG